MLHPFAPSIEDADIALKYDRADPTEFQSFKEELENLKAEKSSLETQHCQMTLAEELAQLELWENKKGK